MKVLVVGAGSYLGARIYKDLKSKYEVSGTYNTNKLFSDLVHLDITNKDLVDNVLTSLNPEVVIHTANFNSPKNIDENSFLEVNREGNINILTGCNLIGARLVFISSLAAETSLNIYGTVKSETENLIMGNKNKYLIIRPSAIFGLSPNIHTENLSNKIIKTIKGEGNFEFDSSWVLQPTYIKHISQVISQAIDNNLWNMKVRVFTNNPVTQYQLASDILTRFNLTAASLDTKRIVPLAPDNQEELKMFQLTPTIYNDLINDFVGEIKTIP